MKISGDVVRQLVERSKLELAQLRQSYDFRFSNVVGGIQPDGVDTRTIVRSREKEFRELVQEISKRRQEAEKFFKKFIKNSSPTLPDVIVKCNDIGELRQCLTRLNDISLYEWVFEIAKYPNAVQKQLRGILTTPRKRMTHLR